MTISQQEISQTLLRQLTQRELSTAAAYVATRPVPAGTRLRLAPAEIDTPWDCYVAFIDCEPSANWGHACRYILIDTDTARTHAIEARFPPGRESAIGQLRLVYRAEGIPNSALLVAS